MYENADVLFQKILEMSPMIVEQIITRGWFQAFGLLLFGLCITALFYFLYYRCKGHEDAPVLVWFGSLVGACCSVAAFCKMISLAFWPELLVLEKLLNKI